MSFSYHKLSIMIAHYIQSCVVLNYSWMWQFLSLILFWWSLQFWGVLVRYLLICFFLYIFYLILVIILWTVGYLLFLFYSVVNCLSNLMQCHTASVRIWTWTQTLWLPSPMLYSLNKNKLLLPYICFQNFPSKLLLSYSLILSHLG